MFESVLKNRLVLYRMQEYSAYDPQVWIASLTLSQDHFDILSLIVEVLKPLQFCTEEISSSSSLVGGKVLVISNVIDQVQLMSVPTRVKMLC